MGADAMEFRGLLKRSRARDALMLPLHPLNEVHIWTVDLAGVGGEFMLAGCLSEEEHRHAHRFHFSHHRRRYVVGRGAVRHVLARYVAEDPSALRFQYGPFGKPELRQNGYIPIHFNITHADDLLICAVGCIPLGVDLEAVSLPPESDAIARMYFAPSEGERLRALPSLDQALAFTRCWTRKEAFIKAIGEGLYHPLDSFEVTFAPHEPAGLQRIGDSEAAADHWSIIEIKTLSGYVGAIAIKEPEPRLRYFRFDGLRDGLPPTVMQCV